MPRAKHALRAASATDTTVPATVPARMPRPKSLGVSKEVIARAHRVGLERADVKAEQLALAIDTQRPNVSRFGLAHEPHSPTSRQLAEPAAPREWVRSIVGVIADTHRLQVIDRAELKYGDNHAARVLAITVELTDVLRVHATAHADGVLCDSDLETIQRETQDALSALLELDAYCSAELAKRRAERAARRT